MADTLNKWSFALSRPLPFLPGFSRPVEYNNLLYFSFCHLFSELSVSFAAEARVHHFIIYITHLFSTISIYRRSYEVNFPRYVPPLVLGSVVSLHESTKR